MAERGSGPGRRGTIATLIGAAALALILFWVGQAIVAHNRLQDCIDSGRRTCTEAPQTGAP